MNFTVLDIPYASEIAFYWFLFADSLIDLSSRFQEIKENISEEEVLRARVSLQSSKRNNKA